MIPDDRARELMVTDQIRSRGIRDDRVLQAFLNVPRHLFVPERNRNEAYEDYPLPIGNSQTISQPFIVAYMTESLEIHDTSTVLEIGTGSGYQAAILAQLAREVYTIEIIEVLFRRARRLFGTLGLDNITAIRGDGYTGHAECGPYDAIMITAAAPVIPKPLMEQLGENGKMVLPLGNQFGYQDLVLVTKRRGKLQKEMLTGVRFVPMTGKVQRAAH